MLKHTALAIVQNLMGAEPPGTVFRESRATRHRSRLRGGLIENRSNWGVVSCRGMDIFRFRIVRQCCAYPCVMKKSRQRSSTARWSRGAVVMRQLVLKTHSAPVH